MKILALEPYYGGSHRAFLSGWRQHSRHAWTVMSLPPAKWKWRMRHAAIHFAQELSQAQKEREPYGLLFCSDMLNLAEFKGLAPEWAARLPALVYFHENQLTYPVLHEKEYDYHFAFSNMTTALAADRVWFNSEFHREDFLSALTGFLRRMPDYQPLDAVGKIREKSDVRHPGIDEIPRATERRPGPLRILWAARWEQDKGPEVFFAALRKLIKQGVAFEIHVVGGKIGRCPLPAFREAKEEFRDRILTWGYRKTRKEYLKTLVDSDVVVSTAKHEFFGISIVEAVAAGAFPLVPRRLAYPEVLDLERDPGNEMFFYETEEKGLAARLAEAAELVQHGLLWKGDPAGGLRIVGRFRWDRQVPLWDRDVESLAYSAMGADSGA